MSRSVFHKSLLAAVAMTGLVAGPVALADHDRGYYRSEPEIRLGVDLIWGGDRYYAPPRHDHYYYAPPRYGYWAPPPYWRAPSQYYGPPGHARGHWRKHHRHDYRGYDRGHDRGRRYRHDDD